MIVPDVNVLLFAHDEMARKHAVARRWWEATLSADEPVGVPWVVVLAFTRLVTHPTICSDPLSTHDARRRVERWFEQPHVRLLVPGTDTFALFFDLLEAAGLGGNLTTDALIAAHAIEHNATLFSPDLDFGRFPDLKWIDPLA